MADNVGTDHPEALALAQVFSTCIECFGLIHPSKEEHAQKVLVAQLGIQQARLLAWGDMVGILDVSASRNPRLEEHETRLTIEKVLQEITDRPSHTDRETQFETFGLKPPKKFTRASEPALDVARIESFRTRLERFQRQPWGYKRGMSITISHWLITDLDKFKVFYDLIKEKVDFLINLFDLEVKVTTAIRHDIKALGWHPVFERTRATMDMTKLRLIKEATLTQYPLYAEAAQKALDYLDTEWAEDYREKLLGRPTSTEIPGVASYMLAQSRSIGLATSGKSKSSEKRPGLLGFLRNKSWKKSGKGSPATTQGKVEENKGRSLSLAQPSTEPLSPPLSPMRSKSISVPMRTSIESEVTTPPESDEDTLAKMRTIESTGDATTVGPVTSMVSRHDYWRAPF